ncbi:MAG: hypothetical protein ACFFD7_14780, partial [Candidatus Thorarchaeota archaeon]
LSSTREKTDKQKGQKGDEQNDNSRKIYEELLKNDLRTLYAIFWYQKNYYKHAIWTRRFTFLGVVIIIIYVILFVILLLVSFAYSS